MMTDWLKSLEKTAGIARDAGRVVSHSLRNLGSLPAKILEEIRSDIDAMRERDPAARSDVEVLLLYSGVHAILAYRVAHKLYLSRHYFSARLIDALIAGAPYETEPGYGWDPTDPDPDNPYHAVYGPPEETLPESAQTPAPEPAQ